MGRSRASLHSSRTPDFRGLLGDDAWDRLCAAVQFRFGPESHRNPRVYPGRMEVRATWLGRAFAQMCRLFGTPIAPWQGAGVPVSVLVWTSADGALVWDRTYEFEGRRPITVSSEKATARDGGLLEVAQGGLGMRLKASVEEGALVFRSLGYFWRLGALSLPIPLLLTPGRALIVHRDEGAGRFTFSMRFVHPLAGETLYQRGLFKDASSRLLGDGLGGGAEPEDIRLGRAA